jgi:outer membrane protein TolC
MLPSVPQTEAKLALARQDFDQARETLSQAIRLSPSSHKVNPKP